MAKQRKGDKMIINALLMLWTVLSILVGVTVYGGVGGPLGTLLVMSAYFITAVVWWFKSEYEK
jgi:hypothetical protein